MVVHPNPADLDLSLLALFAGWAMTETVRRRMAENGFPEVRFNDGVVIQHLLTEPLSISALAQRMGVTQQAASKTVADMDRRGLLARHRSDTDARVTLIDLTDHARAAVDAARTHRAALDAELTADLGEARIAETRAALTAILSRLDADQSIRNRRVRPPI
jgi:DNA-binding MarR family transcriptional regulator